MAIRDELEPGMPAWFEDLAQILWKDTASVMWALLPVLDASDAHVVRRGFRTVYKALEHKRRQCHYSARPGHLWPYGPPEFHERCCLLFRGKRYCDCKASDASDTEWGRGA